MLVIRPAACSAEIVDGDLCDKVRLLELVVAHPVERVHVLVHVALDVVLQRDFQVHQELAERTHLHCSQSWHELAERGGAHLQRRACESQ